MATLPISLLFSIVFSLLLPHSTVSKPPVCDKRYCGSAVQVPIEFPFKLRDANNNESDRCGYPGFELSCNNRKQQALVTLPNAGEFVVKYVSLKQQRVWINDPDECLPRRFIQSIDLTNSPFIWDQAFHYFQNLFFLNCSKSAGDYFTFEFDPLQRVPCMSDDKYLIIYTLDSPPDPRNSSCYVIGSASVPVKDRSQQPRLISEGLHSDLVLQWTAPLCGGCEGGQQCGFLSNTGLDVTCYDNNSDSPTPSPSPREGGCGCTRDCIIAVVILLFILLVGPVGFCVYKRIWVGQLQHATETSIELESNTAPHVALPLEKHDGSIRQSLVKEDIRPSPPTKFAPRPKSEHIK